MLNAGVMVLLLGLRWGVTTSAGKLQARSMIAPHLASLLSATTRWVDSKSAAEDLFTM
jgi:hypothetical protein